MITDWSVVAYADFLAQLVDRCDDARPAVVGVNGHSSSGKTSLAQRLAAGLPECDVLHTDDLAWHQGVLAWDTLLVDEVLPVVRSGTALDFRPPQWVARGRTDSISLRSCLHYLVVEGVGASQPSVCGELDAVIWVETEEPTRLGRDAIRVEENGEMSVPGYRDWMAEENAYVVAERPWESADLVVYGGLAIPHDPAREIVLALTTPPR